MVRQRVLITLEFLKLTKAVVLMTKIHCIGLFCVKGLCKLNYDPTQHN
jgi:hypothetical protein